MSRPARTAYAAVEIFAREIQLILSCLTRAVPKLSRATDPLLLSLDASPLEGAGSVAFRVNIHFRPEQSGTGSTAWRVKTAAYYYTLFDNEQHEILAWHWHPEARGALATPHLHLEFGARVGRPELAGTHLPTGHLALEEIVRYLLSDWGVQPQRADWSAVLDRTFTNVEARRAW